MTRILTIIGARPQFIKAAAVSRAFQGCAELDEVIVHTGQHFDANMSDIFFDEMGIPRPSYNLEISGGTHGQMTGRMLERLETVMQEVQPAAVLIYGDTNSTLAGALAAAKLHIPIAHVEAGLRSFNRAMPEEINRVLSDQLSEVLLTPTDIATRNLANESIDGARVVQVGDVMYDAAQFFGGKVAEQNECAPSFQTPEGPYVLATVHRQENTDVPERLQAIFEGLAIVAKSMPVVLPLHPRTRGRLAQAGFEKLLEPLTVVDPMGYLEMVAHEQSAAVIATDSGGVQKEAFFYGVPCVTLRDETEWVELVEAGWNRLVPPLDAATISRELLNAVGRKGADVSPYGAGNASELIVAELAKRFAQ